MRHRRPNAVPALVFLAGSLAPPTLLAAPESVIENSAIFAAIPVSETELSAQRGRYKPELVQFSSQELDAVLEENSASGTVNGHNTIADDAFKSAQGHVSIIQNTGNNVIIQDTAIYNITFMD
jgi:hypothetical protein